MIEIRGPFSNFKDADLIGIPIRVTVGNRFKENGESLKIKIRSENKNTFYKTGKHNHRDKEPYKFPKMIGLLLLLPTQNFFMADISCPKPVKLFVGILSSDNSLLEEVENLLSNRLGKVDIRSEIFPFDFTEYYKKDMGTNISRQFLSFKELINPEKTFCY